MHVSAPDCGDVLPTGQGDRVCGLAVLLEVRGSTLMHELELVKPDGRRMTLYSRTPIPAGIRARNPAIGTVRADPHLRWHPLRHEWVAYATHRQARTFQPPPQYDPLRASNDPVDETELPAGDYDIAVFDNLFPVLSADANAPPAIVVPTEAARGHCEVVVFTQDASESLAELGVDRVELLLEVWGRRTDARIFSTCCRSKIEALKSASRSTTRTGRSTPIRTCRRYRGRCTTPSATISRLRVDPCSNR